jgi:ATP-binding cassette subfamily B protein/subfamily B ATP-binding cassette protein MsbA
MRILWSVVCALGVALLWGGNFTAIYPILKLLTKDTNLQGWIDKELREKEATIASAEKEIEKRTRDIETLQQQEPTPQRDQRLAEFMHNLSKHEYNLSISRWTYGWLQWGKLYVIRLCPEDRFQTLATLMGLLVGAVFFKGIFDFFQESLVGSVVSLSLLDLRNRLYRNVLRLDVGQFSEEGTHDLMARFTNDMETLATGIKTLLGKLIAEPLKAISCVVFACMISWRLTLFFLILVPIALVTMSRVGRYMKRAGRRVLESMSSLYKILQETFQGIKVVKAFTMERHERRRFFLATKDYYRKGMCVVNLEAIASPVMELIAVLAIAGALLAGAYLVLNKETHIFGLRMSSEPLEPESLLALYALLAAISDPVRKLSNVYNRIQSGAAAADRIFTYLDRQPAVPANGNGQQLPRHERTIEFQGVCFSYHHDQPILSNVNLTVKQGETIAIVGRNGCGKTTLMGLLARFLEPTHGTILVDGIDIRHVTLRSLRQQLGYVTQETILFDDTIYNNITYGSRYARREEVESATKRAFAHEFVMRTKQGYSTRIGELGSALSGGQRQRLSLARAFIRKPSILILDEFTSASDPESEMLIHKALREGAEERTTFIITHRLGTLEIADRIVVLEAGRIEAVGSHEELLRSCRTYQRLQEVQHQRQAA